MPLNRSPPPVPASSARMPAVAALTVPSAQLQHSSSEPSLLSGASARAPKRMKPDCDYEKIEDFMDNMTKLFLEFKEVQEKKAEKICAAVEDMRTTIDFMADKYYELKGNFETLLNERKDDKLYIKSLEDKIDQFERNSRATCIEIRNVPSSPNETKSTLLETLISVGKALDIAIKPSDVKDIFRIKSKEPTSKTIIADLTSTLLKDIIIRNYRKFNKTYKSFTTENLKIKGPQKPVYISENLTAKMKKLFFQAREFSKRNEYRYCWVSHGKIFLRKGENGTLVRVQTESDLERITCSSSQDTNGPSQK